MTMMVGCFCLQHSQLDSGENFEGPIVPESSKTIKELKFVSLQVSQVLDRLKPDKANPKVLASGVRDWRYIASQQLKQRFEEYENQVNWLPRPRFWLRLLWKMLRVHVYQGFWKKLKHKCLGLLEYELIGLNNAWSCPQWSKKKVSMSYSHLLC